ncbi:MAG: glycosyltransferase family 4 protein [Ruminococcus sp.]|nr:glycosyltransferase family 4 protein [Ruminococcus sp.]
MKVVIFINKLQGGGAERVACALANYLFDKGIDVELMVFSKIDTPYNLNQKIKVHALLTEGKVKPAYKMKLFRALKKYVEAHQVDTYICFLPLSIIIMLLNRAHTNSQIVVSERNNPENYPRIIRFLLKRLMIRADKIVFQTKNAREWYANNIQLKNTCIIPNAVNNDFIVPLYSGQRRKVIVAVGRLVKQKNFALLIHAFKNISSKYSDYELRIFGEGPERSNLEEIIAANKLENRVLLMGQSNNIVKQIQDASIFVLSSDFEGMPNALIEAMALGLPCISTDCRGGGAKFLIQNNMNGILVPINDVNSLSSAIDKLLRDPDYSKSIGEAAYMFSKSLAPESIYEKWFNFICD